MARSAFNGFQASVRDMYPNLTGSLSMTELTIPEEAELDVVAPRSATANVEGVGVVRQTKRSDSWTFLGMLAGAVILLWLLGRS
jgi:hypothetical protein